MKVKKLAFQIADPIRRFYWFIFRPTRRGAKCLVEHNGKFLFIRNSYGSGRWTIPGGGAGFKESVEATAIREAEEEVGIRVNNLKLIGTYESTQEYKTDRISLFYSEVDSPLFKIDPSEIAEARWVSLDAIPEPHGSVVEILIGMFKNFKK